jgi:hypothetical protein
MNQIYNPQSEGKDLMVSTRVGTLPSKNRNTFAQNADDRLRASIGRAGLSQSDQDEGSWTAIVDLIFDVVAHRDRLALKRKALGRHKRRLARKLSRKAAR